MGDPKKVKKKYDTPQHPWNAKRQEEEGALKEEYGLKNKAEIWKALTMLRKIKQQAKKLIAADTEQAKKEEKQLIEKLVNLNLLSKGDKVEDVLGIDGRAVLDRRLQSIVFKKDLARSIRQARQFITHKHIIVGDSIVNKPSYLVRKDEESKICFDSVSSLSKSDHPERTVEKKEKSKVLKVKKKPVEKVLKPKDTAVKIPEKEIKEKKK